MDKQAEKLARRSAKVEKQMIILQEKARNLDKGNPPRWTRDPKGYNAILKKLASKSESLRQLYQRRLDLVARHS